MTTFGKLGQEEAGPKYAKSALLNDADLMGVLYREPSVRDALKRLAELRDPDRNMNAGTGDDRKLVADKEKELRASVNELVGSKRGDGIQSAAIDVAVARILEVEKQLKKRD